MNRTVVILASAAVVAASAAWLSYNRPDEPNVYRRAESVRRRYLADLDTLDSTFAALERSVSGSPADAQAAFRRARLAYKSVEGLSEYYAPGTARLVNGPVLDRAEEEAPNVILRPMGFQVVEEALFPPSEPSDAWRAVVDTQARGLRINVKRFRHLTTETQPTDGHIFEAARLELARVVTLGLAGFDASLSGDAVHEAAAAIRGVRRSLSPYAGSIPNKQRAVWDSTLVRLERSAAYLDAHPDFESLDRLAFIVGYANPAMRSLEATRQALQIDLPASRTVWTHGVATLFDSGAFDASALAPAYAPKSTAELVSLGKALFFDPSLSGTGARACASCHQPEHAFTDGQARRAGLSGTNASGRNTPTVLNVGLQPGSFFDQRTAYLEDQVTDVIGNAEEMGHSVDGAATRLRKTGAYDARFASAFGVARDSALSAERLRMALAAYLRSLETLSSRFDRAVRGDTAQLSASERRGFNVFMGKAKCATCHFAPLFNGATPPMFTEAEPEVVGTPAGPRGTPGHAKLDPDVGRAGIDRVPLHRFAFKTPTLRNIALTAPYMHNGVFRTLDEVIDFYDGGGGAGLGLTMPQQTLPPDSLRLTKQEKQELIDFMRALTDSTVR